MALFGQTEISIVLRMWVYFRRLFLCGGGREGERVYFITMRQQEFGKEPKRGWEANIKPMYIRISISDSFITGVSLSTLYVQVHDCQLKNSITDPTHPLIFLNLHLLAWATWRRDLSPKPQIISLKKISARMGAGYSQAIIQFLSLSLAHFTQSARLEYINLQTCANQHPTFIFPQKKRETKNHLLLKILYRSLIHTIPFVTISIPFLT